MIIERLLSKLKWENTRIGRNTFGGNGLNLAWMPRTNYKFIHLWRSSTFARVNVSVKVERIWKGWEQMRTKWKGPWERCFKVDMWLEMVRHDNNSWELLIGGHFRAPPFPLMTSWRPDDVIVEIFKIAQKWSKLTGYCLNRPCKSSCQVSDRHGQRLGSNRLFSWAFCREVVEAVTEKRHFSAECF